MRQPFIRGRIIFLLVSLGIFLFSTVALSAGNMNGDHKITIIHTNDIHSHLLGFGPNIDYTPYTTRDDMTVGGIARIATIIKQIKETKREDVLVLDAGDFMMGSLFHMIGRQEGVELRTLKRMGYDVVTIGNHEFDLRPSGLARIINAAAKEGDLPALVSSNVVFDPADKEDDTLEEIFNEGLVTPYRVMSKGGIKIGIFGLMGKDAAEVAPFAAPVKFSDQIETAKKMVDTLRNDKDVDLVICLSHSGLDDPKGKSGEDVTLAKKVKGIDAIISGHTHTLVEEPIVVGDTLIVQVGCYGQYVGVLDLSVGEGKVSLDRYRLIKIDDSIKADKEIQQMVEDAEDIVTKDVLSGGGLCFGKVIAETGFDLINREQDSNLGNLVADSIRYAIDEYEYNEVSHKGQRTDIAVESNGVIRDDILMGTTGRLAVCDLFRAVPLGVGMREDTLGYPLVSVYLNASEIKKALEVITSIYPIKGSDYFLQVSGLKFRYNPHRVIFDRVVDIYIGDDERGYRLLDTSAKNKELYKVGSNIYNASFLKIIGDFTWGILTIVPKDKHGNPIKDMRDVIVDADPDKPGIQELKEWMGFTEYVAGFDDTDGDGISDIPLRYKAPQGRITPVRSWNPILLLKNSTYPTWIASGGIILVLAVIVVVVL